MIVRKRKLRSLQVSCVAESASLAKASVMQAAHLDKVSKASKRNPNVMLEALVAIATAWQEFLKNSSDSNVSTNCVDTMVKQLSHVVHVLFPVVLPKKRNS